MGFLARLSSSKQRKERFPLGAPYESAGGYAWVTRLEHRIPQGDDEAATYRSAALLVEDGIPMLGAHAPHERIRRWGGGLYSHWGGNLLFSASDNSNPNTNGRRYELELSLDAESWERARLTAATELWRLHPAAAVFLERGGRDTPPPVLCNLGLTNKCNLRCEICGSQKSLDETGVLRRHMDFGVFQAVAEAIFPFMFEVELNSQGDPLLHPQIPRILETIARHDCDLKLQTNGTLFSDKVIEALDPMCGTVMLSLDAVGPKFDEVRRGGHWASLEPQLTKYLSRRNPRRQRVGLYPTLTKRTIGEAVNVAKWAEEHGAEEVSFHRYNPIKNSFEQAPSAVDLEQVRDDLREWLTRGSRDIDVRLDGLSIGEAGPADRRTEFASARKRAMAPLSGIGNIFPMEAGAPFSHPVSICPAPLEYVEVGLEGQIGACCRAQDVVLGYATSVAAFADAWFGENYRKIRDSLRRDAVGDFPLPNCEGCIAFHAPHARGQRHAVQYDGPSFPSSSRLNFADVKQIRLEAIQKERGYCYTSRLPPGIPKDAFALWEGDRPLGPPDQLHDNIRSLGEGRYSIWGRNVYFSASDNVDARTNGRVYMLRNVSLSP